MSDAEILKEIERSLSEWFDPKYSGWAEENAGFLTVRGWIKELRECPDP